MSRRGGRGGHLSREVLLSKSLSKLLRHKAQEEGIPITSDGWVRCDDLLAWRGLNRATGASGGGGNSGVTMQDIAEVVKGNEKKRFGLRWVGDSTTSTESASELSSQPVSSASEIQTERAVETILNGEDEQPKNFLIRANQGHSIKDVGTEDLMVPVTLESLDSVLGPDNDGLIVHGTFYGAWRPIMASGGLRRMGRNHVHFATGPKLAELAIKDGNKDRDVGGKLAENKVISGMRSDAQILIYVDLRKSLEESASDPEKGTKWFRSENGVILTEGIGGDDDGQGLVPTNLWKSVVEIKKDLGVLWTPEAGDLKKLSEELLSKAVPQGKGGHGNQRGGGRGRGRGRGDGGQGRSRGDRQPKMRDLSVEDE